MMKNLRNKTKNGYALLELLFYISFFVVLVLVVINAMVIMAQSFKETSIQAELVQSGTIMERISREIRSAVSINSISTTDLALKTGDSRNPEFKLSGTNLQLWENGALVGNLNTPNVIITNLTFSQISTTQSNAARVALTFRLSDDSSARLSNFYDTVVLRGSY